ncbi:MAG: amidase [Pseudomonadota bacterium]
MTDLADISANDALAKIKAGEITSEQLVSACLDRIDAREPDVQAWTFLDPSHAIAQARARDAAQARGEPIGPLHGIPVGIKDIIDTADMPTQNGSAHFTDHQPEHDARCIAVLRSAGAVIMGKTVTTELANMTPGKTRNPHNPAHTPGGSSSGSAAAVACGMVPLALGTQTGGSVVRPASFCGIHGLKPTRGLIPRTGVTLQSHTLDTVGVYGRSLADIATLTHALDVYDATDDVSYPRARSTEALAIDPESGPEPRLAFFKSPAWPAAEPDAKAAIARLVATLGDRCPEVELPSAFDTIIDDHQAIQLVESDYHYAPLRDKNAELLSQGLRDRMAAGGAILAKDYLTALQRREQHYALLTALLDRYDALVCLSSTGPAPASLATTGNAIFNGLWTFLGVPTVSLPLMTVGELPCGVTLVGKRREETRLLRVAARLEHSLRS